MPAKTRYLEIDTGTTASGFTVSNNRSERVEASQITTSSLTGTQVRLQVMRSSVSTQLAHDIFIPAEKIVEPLFRGITFESGDKFEFFFAVGASTSKTWLTITTDEQVV